MDKMKLLHGQSLSMQWVGFAIQKIVVDLGVGGQLTKQLLGDAKPISIKENYTPLLIGCNYVINFVLAFAIELALKALLFKEGKNPKFVHDLYKLYEDLSEETKIILNNEYVIQKSKGGSCYNDSIEMFLKSHRNDFVEWRYLDKVDKIKKEDKEMQLVICTLLEVYNSHKQIKK